MHDNPALTKAPQDYLVTCSEQFPVNLVHINAEFYPEIAVKHAAELQGRYNIAYFFWETETCPTACELGRDIADEIWVPSAFNARPFRDAPVPVINVGTSVTLPRFRQVLTRADLNIEPNAYLFLFSYDSHSVIHRKNPVGVVRAFLQAFPRGTERTALIIKTHNAYVSHWGGVNGRWDELMELCSRDRRIKVLDRTFGVDEMYSLKSIIDCYVSLHRSEGFGYGPAEAMSLGKAVIASNYSGNLEYCRPDNSFLVDGRLVHVMHDEYLYWTPGMMWWDPSVEHAACYMRMLYENPAIGRRAGEVGREYLARHFSVANQAAKYRDRLCSIYAGLNTSVHGV
jgi:glycosyltransferase involved in cell wall biosynthesis